MKWNDDGFIVPIRTGLGEVPPTAMEACPFKPADSAGPSCDEDDLADVFLADSKRRDDEIGRFENTYIGYSVANRPNSSSGGLATFIFDVLLRERAVDHIFVVIQVGTSYEYRIISDLADIQKTSKTRYVPVTLEELFDKVATIEGRIAVSGVACFIKAVRMRQSEDPVLKERICFLVGIICGGLKSGFFTEYLADRAGAGLAFSSAQYRVKNPKSTSSDYSFAANDSFGTTHTLRMALVGDMWGSGMFKAKACDFCTDVLTELADISLGDAWLPEYRKDGLGNSVIVTRSKLAEHLIQSGIASGKLNANLCEPSQIVASQRSSFLHRRDALGFRVALARIMGQPLPYFRKRVLKRISVSYMAVQVQRELTRTLSLTVWRKYKSARKFDQKMRPHVRALRFLTRINQRLRNR